MTSPEEAAPEAWQINAAVQPLPAKDAWDGRAKVLALQSAMEALPPERLLNLEPRNHFADGAYAREVTIPAGAVAVGKIHKTAHICVISQGVVDVLNEAGEVTRVRAPATFVSPAGTKRAVYAITDTVWTVFHPTGERDLAKIEATFIAQDFAELEASGALDAWQLGTEAKA